MTDTLQSTKQQVILPKEPDLVTLAQQINAEHDALKEALLSGAQ